MGKIQCIGILTSGGDAPGMNAAIRAVTRAGISNGFNIMGVYRGYEGLIKGEVKPFTTEDVSGIITRGGTILKTARCKEFTTPEGRQKAFETCQRVGIDALVVIGGNGSLTGARDFGMEFDFPVIGLPGTIDNDLYGTDATIGYDTTMNTIMECVDRIRDTANSHERIFFVEVMGRDAGFLAQNCAIACGAEAAIVPEETTDVDQLAQFMGRGIRKSKKSCIVIVSESPKCGALYYADRVKKEFTCSAAAVRRPTTASWPAAPVQEPSKPSSRDSGTSWSASATTKWSMSPSASASAPTNASTNVSSRCSTS